ncbi:hypothetical protein Bca4012_004167 [Brassica carinata]|uniref:DUF4283 domain-containing protein n=1 Tax=Brassica carinata TaxID=52824 RepID=A0A8X7UWF1_BRACI|nr:hypothetical protein Bca52824_041419 [Brassica carinata]
MLKLGADKDRWTVHEDVQNLAGMKVALPRIWQLVNKVEGKVNDDDTVNFYFAKEQHLQRVMENAPYTYRG